MPEGDTVRNHADRLNKALAGTVVTRSDFRVPALATVDLSGWTVTGCASRGKHLLLRLTKGADPAGSALTLHSHLRMDGTWRLFRPDERPHGWPAHLIRVVLRTEKATAVGYHLHDLRLIRTGEESALLDHLGPDLLGPDWDPAEAVRRLGAEPGREIGAALLDQRNLAGIGNLYRCELLFLRGIRPGRTVAESGDLEALVTLAQRLVSANVGRWTQTTTGSLRKGEEHWVYGRFGRPCRRCGTLIRRAGGDGEDRVAYWCPTCQPPPPSNP
jgi:endonuclease-8